MGRDELAALIAILQTQSELGRAGHALGVRHISFDERRRAFTFDKCEAEGYCEERPAVIALDGSVLDPGGPIVDALSS
jgi:hypothetical protein